MNFKNTWQRISNQFTATPQVAIGAAIALLIVSLTLALYNDNLRRDENIRRVQVQARILAGSVAAALAFEDIPAIQEYINALRVNPEVDAVGVYNVQGKLMAGFANAKPALPTKIELTQTIVNLRTLAITDAVVQGNIKLGFVHLRITIEPLGQRIIHNLGIGIVIIMACLLVVVLAASHASVSEAHHKLQQETKDREKAEEALRQSQKMEALGQLTGGVAHDFNNLLMVVSSGLELMERTSDASKQQRLKQGLRQAIDRGARLTQQLLAFARRAPLKPQVTDMGDCLRNMHDLLERSLREDIVVELNLPLELWPVEIDVSQFEVAVLNIALNARDAMPKGGAIVIRAENVIVATGQAKNFVKLSIADTGTGVPPEALSRVFEPFFTTKDVGKGTGLGLSQVYGFARASNGDVTIESELDRGTVVSLLLPRSHKPVQKPTLTSAPLVPPISSEQRRHCILLVEDDTHVAAVVTQMLSELGYDSTHVPSADAALALLNSTHAFDAVLSDMVMPGEMDGLDLARVIADKWPALPIVLTTGYSAAATTATAHGLRLLLKPYTLEALSRELLTALSKLRSVG